MSLADRIRARQKGTVIDPETGSELIIEDGFVYEIRKTESVLQIGIVIDGVAHTHEYDTTKCREIGRVKYK
ncbi:hypothetical protein K8R33_02650 [archaeon]|nr:hypothetical protein [archaeon]